MHSHSGVGDHTEGYATNVSVIRIAAKAIPQA